MSVKQISLVVGAAMMLAGCGTSPAMTTLAPVDMATVNAVETSEATVATFPETGGYGLLGLSNGTLPLKEVCASTTRKWFPLCHLTDNKPSTAWRPCETDNCPTLTYEFCSPAFIKELSIKQDGAQAFDVEVWDGQCWKTVKCNLEPRNGCFSTFDICAVACKIRLKFSGRCIGENLTVCQVDFCGTKAPVLELPPITVTPSVTETTSDQNGKGGHSGRNDAKSERRNDKRGRSRGR